MQRGKQYMRAVQLYYRKFHAYPPNADALVKTNEIRFLRKKYLDPMTGKDDWKPIPVGQNKTQSMGFFGQPIGGSSLGGIGPSGGNGLNGIGGTGIGGSNNGGLGNNGALGATGTTDNGSSNGSTDSSGSGTDGTGQNGGTGPGTPGNGTPGSGNGTTFGGNGQTFGGIGIMGFKPGSTKQSILVYKKKNHYNEWEFFYDPYRRTNDDAGRRRWTWRNQWTGRNQWNRRHQWNRRNWRDRRRRDRRWDRRRRHWSRHRRRRRTLQPSNRPPAAGYPIHSTVSSWNGWAIHSRQVSQFHASKRINRQ